MLVTGASRVNVHVSFCDNYLIQFFCVLGGMNPDGGGGGYSTTFYTGRLHPKVQPLTLLYTIFDRKGTPFSLKNGTPFTYLIKNTASLNPWNAVNERHCERTDANQKLLSTRNILIKGPFKYLSDRFPYPFIYFSS